MTAESPREGRGKRLVIQIALVVLVLAAGAAALAALTLSKEPPPKREVRETRPLVRVLKVDSAPIKVEVMGEGTVTPVMSTTLAAEVAGKIVKVSPAMVNGGSFKAGEMLYEIDPVDYRLALDLARATVKERETALRLTQEESKAAREEWKLLYQDSGEKAGPPPDLVAKVPQLAQAEAALKAAKAQLLQAELNLDRTKVSAPYAGRVETKIVDLGQHVAKGNKLADIYSTEAAEVSVQIEDGDLAWIAVPGLTPGAGPGSAALVRADFAGKERTWAGRVVRSTGMVDQRTRMVPVIVQVDRPYASLPPLAAGMFVKVAIQGKTVPSASLIPRSALHDGKVWAVDAQGKIVFTPVSVVRHQGPDVLVSPGLPGGRVVLSQLKTVTEGMAVRVAAEPKPDKAGENS